VRDFRYLTLTCAALALLAGCGESSEPAASAPSHDASHDGHDHANGDHADQAAIDQARRDAADATAAAGDLDPLASLGDATATEALESYIAACTAGDFIRAAEFCHPNSPGTARLKKLGENFIKASNDPATAGMNLGALMTEGFDQITFSTLEEGENRWAFEVTVPNKQPVRIEVAKLDEGWRVLPPESSGLPVN